MPTDLKDRPRYDDDFYAWTQDQAKLLRAQVVLGKNEPIDWHLLAEEVEDLGKSELHTCESLTEQIIAHLLKLQLSTATQPRAGWEEEIAAFRIGLEQKLTASLQRRLVDQLDRRYANALRRLKPQMRRHQPDMLGLLPPTCPYTFDQILGTDDWLPRAERLASHS
jgi:hypothetical protein